MIHELAAYFPSLPPSPLSTSFFRCDEGHVNYQSRMNFSSQVINDYLSSQIPVQRNLSRKVAFLGSLKWFFMKFFASPYCFILFLNSETWDQNASA